MEAFLANLEIIAATLGVIASLLGTGVAYWSAKRTREEFYDDYLRRKSRNRDIDVGD